MKKHFSTHTKLLRMRKFSLFLFAFFLLTFSAKAGFNIWGSAIYLNVNGTSGFYNTQKLTGSLSIGNNTFSGMLGVFGKNSGTLKILGAEINTGKSNGATVCGGTFFYTVYRQGNRPAVPVFSSFSLMPYCSCNGTIFSGCGDRACNSTNDQKLQNATQSVDLTSFETGDYTLEIYYQANGTVSGIACNEQVLDNAANLNYTANFSITSPLSINMVFLNGAATDEDIKVKWVVQNDVDITKYEVQKSDNGLNFTTVQGIPSNQNIANNTYLFSDQSPIFGTNYYRIKSYNINNTVNLSPVFRIYFGKVGNTIFIYPNPSGPELTVRLAAVKKGNYRMSVFGTNGQTITTMPLYHDGVDKTVRINLPVTLSRGIYRLFLIDKVQFYKQSFLVK